MNRRSFDPYRRRSDRVAAGVAGGLADTLGIADVYVRAAFVTLTAIWGLGLFLYIAFWLATFDDVDDREAEPVSGQQSVGISVAFVGLMILLLTIGWWPNEGLVLITAALSFGTAALTDRNVPGPLASLIDPNVDQPGRIRTLFGVALLIGGLAFLASSVGPIAELGSVLLAVGLTGIGLFVAFGPWVKRLVKDLGAERRERVRQEERAEMAAHLHDSVLQTLALIQRSDDPGRMSILARHQEGELRDWLYGESPLDGVDLMSTALKAVASRVEADYQVPVEVVTVGDVALTEELRPLLGAAGEAMVNAAKHSGADQVSAYMEVQDGLLELFITDQGKGFDLNGVGADRKGIEHSIVGRAGKAGADVSVDSELGVGTEVLISLNLEKP